MDQGLNPCFLHLLYWQKDSLLLSYSGSPLSKKGVQIERKPSLACLVEKALYLTASGQHIKKQRHYCANKGASSQSYGFYSSHIWMWELDQKESWELKNWCFWTVVLEKTLESPLDCKEIQPVHPKGDQSWQFIGKHWCWSWSANTLVTWCKELARWKRPWCWERLKAGGEGDERGWDGWMASPTWWTWVWASFRSWWWTGKPGVLQSMESQRVGHDWATELNRPLISYFLEENWSVQLGGLSVPLWTRPPSGTDGTRL